MSNRISRTWAEIDLDIIRDNIKILRKITHKSAKMMGIIKADAYGHGYLEVAKTLIENGIDYFGVAAMQEAKQLRRNDIKIPILILSYVDFHDIPSIVDLDIIPSVFDVEFAKAISDYAKSQNKTARIHLKIDTGMSRLGFVYNEDTHTNEETVRQIGDIVSLPNLFVEGIYSHFAVSDIEDRSFTTLQFKRFIELNQRLAEKGICIPIRHICNSAGIIEYPEMHLDMVRAGIAMYGLYPSDCVKNIGLKPAMTLKSSVTQIKEIHKGDTVSYGRIYEAQQDIKIAVVPIGYADGYLRNLSGKIQMIVDGQKCNQIGKICMDQCMLDVTNVKNIAVGDEIIIIGGKDGNNITVEEIADLTGTINYEIICDIGKRVPRVYLSDGKVAKVLNYLEQESF